MISTERLNDHNYRVMIDGEQIGHLMHYTAKTKGWAFGATHRGYVDSGVWPTFNEALQSITGSH